MTSNKRAAVPIFSSVSGFVLAGGASRRMGRPKALLKLDGETMLERQVRFCQMVTGSVSVVGWPEDLSRADYPSALRKVTLLRDEIPGQGPLVGILTGLRQTRTQYNLFLSCDMPFVDAPFLEFLCRRALFTRADVTVPTSQERRLNPVCAVYRRKVYHKIQCALATGNRKMTGFYSKVCCEVIPWREIVRAGFPPRVFDNMNTLREYHRAKKYLKSFPQE